MTLPITPITDRTEADTAYARQHPDNPTYNKGALNYTDLNRIETNCRYICDQLVGYGYSVQITTKTDWLMTDYPKRVEIDRIRKNVITLRTKYYTLQGSPDVLVYDSLRWDDVNSLEQNLANLDELLQRMVEGFRRCGTFTAGQEVIL